VRRILTTPRIYRHISDDASPARETYRPVESEAVWYVLAIADDGEALGVFMLVPQNAVCWEVHTCLLPHAWGAKAIQAARELPGWIGQHTTCRRIITNVPDYNRLARSFAERAGMRQFGVNQRSYLRHGQLHDQIMLGLSLDQEK
jgi:RimJ/RimL family protein N-acetyltransferase